MKYNVYLYNSSCASIQATGVDIDLFDIRSNLLLQTKRAGRMGSSEWGAVLTWSSVAAPLDIVITDATGKYLPHAVEQVNGKMSGRIDVALVSTPQSAVQPGPAGTGGLLTRGGLQRLHWSNHVSTSQRRTIRAALNLYFRFVRIARSDTDGVFGNRMANILAQWAKMFRDMGIPVPAPEQQHDVWQHYEFRDEGPGYYVARGTVDGRFMPLDSFIFFEDEDDLE